MIAISSSHQGKLTGFTLVEVLIALTLFSFILILLFSSLYSASRSWQAGAQLVDGNDDLRLVTSFIRKHLTQTVPLIYVDKKNNPILFKGETDAIHFVSRLPSHRGGGGLHLLSFMITRQDLRKDLTLKYQPVNPDIDFFNNLDSDDIKTLTLIENIEDIELSYYGGEAKGEDPSWNDEWENKKRLPDLVRIQITKADSGQYWPELLISISAQTARGQPQLSLTPSKEFTI